MTAMEDIFDQVQAPSWAETLLSAGNDFDEDEDTFFPQPEAGDEIAAIEEVTVQMTQLTVVNPPVEDPEDLSRMAMFGNKREVKRRSQIRKEQEAVKPETLAPSRPTPRVSSFPRPVSRSSSIPRAPSVTRTSISSTPKTTAPTDPRSTGLRAGPVTRSQTRSVTGTTPAPVVVERRSRDMGRNASTGNRSTQPSPTPNQIDFNQALTRRAGSFGDGVRTPLAAPRQPRAIPAPRPPSVTRVAPTPVSRPVPPVSKPNPINRVRVPVTVVKSPKMAFGSAVRPKPQTTRKSVIQDRTIATKPVPLRVYPSPSGSTPAKGLTYPRTPVVAKRASSVTRAPAVQVQSAPKTTERKVLKARDIQGMVDRLSKPKASVVRPPTASTPKRTIPNTYTHGINTTRAIVRSRSNSRPPSQNSTVRNENIEALPAAQ